MNRRIIIFLAAILITIRPAFARATYIPVVSGLFSTGQWYFDGNKSELGGNLALTFVPALQFSNKLSVIPTIQTNYRGTRSAEELAGGNTFFHDTWENGVNVKAVQGLNSRWSLKENVGYRFKWFRETVDETWNHGLYDYHIYNIGTELERRWGKTASVGLGYDFSYTLFPNYSSLESSQGSDNAREFAGSNVLDTRSHLVSLRIRAPLFWNLTSSFQNFYSPREYTAQTVVVRSGLLTSEHRKDDFVGSNVSLERVFRTPLKSRLISSVQFGYAKLNSNQNHYDAEQTTFVADFYDYHQLSSGVQFTLAFGNPVRSPMLIDMGYAFSQRNYSSRVIQSESGVYMGEKLYQIEQAINLGFSYPLTKNLRVKTTSTFGQSKSNNDYEAVYHYNYHNAEYQFGFTYDY